MQRETATISPEHHRRRYRKTYRGTCLHCGVPFMGRSDQVYCGETCVRAAYRDRARDRAQPAGAECARCGKPIAFGGRGRRPKYCGRECRVAANYLYEPPSRETECIYCGKPFKAVVQATKRRHCSASCRNQMGHEGRNARRRGRFVERVGIKYLIERDGGLCKLCGEPVDLTAVAPDRFSPTTDHIIPFARGGVHSKANCQLAHFSCNSAKGAR